MTPEEIQKYWALYSVSGMRRAAVLRQIIAEQRPGIEAIMSARPLSGDTKKRLAGGEIDDIDVIIKRRNGHALLMIRKAIYELAIERGIIEYGKDCGAVTGHQAIVLGLQIDGKIKTRVPRGYGFIDPLLSRQLCEKLFPGAEIFMPLRAH